MIQPILVKTYLRNKNTTQNIILLFSLPQHTPRVPETGLNHSCSTSRSYKSGCCKASASDINSCSKIAPRLQHLHQGNAVNKQNPTSASTTTTTKAKLRGTFFSLDTISRAGLYETLLYPTLQHLHGNYS